jgi:hypothetical protein
MSDENISVTPAPRAKLEPADLDEIHNALVEGYTVAELRQRLLLKWGLRLDRKLNLDAPFGSDQLFGLLTEWTERQGRTLDLLALAWTGNPGNDYLAAAAARLLPDQAGARALYEDKRLPMRPASLEATVNKRSHLIGYDLFLSRYQSLGRAICRIETGFKQGTGFLVGRRSVLTNFHVVEEAIANLPLGEKIVCRFDFHGAGEEEVAGTPLMLAADWLGPNSPYSQSDLTGTGSPESGELDFALLHLAEPVVERLSLALSTEPRVVVPGDVAMVAQHPGGAELAIAYGVLTSFPADGLRYRYDCTTGHGASGAPMLSADLDLIGLHHAADPDLHPDYNQAVPTFRIARAIEEAGLTLAAL